MHSASLLSSSLGTVSFNVTTLAFVSTSIVRFHREAGLSARSSLLPGAQQYEERCAAFLAEWIA